MRDDQLYLNKNKMSKQKQQLYCSFKKRGKSLSTQNQSQKRNKQILETYIVANPNTRSASVYEMVEAKKPQSLKKKHSDRYYLVNTKAKLLKRVQTELADHDEDEYLNEIKSLRTQIKDFQRDIENKKLQQYEDEYFSEIKNIKTEIVQLKSIQKGLAERRAQEDIVNDIYEIKDELKELKKEFTLKRSSGFLPPIHIYPSVNLNPQSISLPIKKHGVKKSPPKKKPITLTNPTHHDELLEELKSQVQQLKREILLSKQQQQQPLNNSYDLLSQSRIHSLGTNTPLNIFQKSQRRRSSSNKRIRDTYSRRDNKDQSTSDEMIWKKNVRNQALRKIKKVANGILFVHRLQKFSQKIRLKRQNFFKESFQDGLLPQVKTIRDIYVKATQQFMESLPLNDPQSSIVIVPADNQSQRITKAGLVRKCINKFLDAIKETEFLPNIMDTLTETCYFVCRHGSAGVISNYFTSEELDIMCISKGSLKVMAEKNLEKCQIISFILLKLITFNILLRTESVPELKLQKNTIWNANFALLGSIFYQLCRKIQAQIIERVPLHYVIGNWKHLNFLHSKSNSYVKAINPSKSMIINLRQHEKVLKIEDIPNELIQGTVSKRYLSDVYEFQDWEAEMRRISNYVQLIHRRMCKYHAKLKDQLL